MIRVFLIEPDEHKVGRSGDFPGNFYLEHSPEDENSPLLYWPESIGREHFNGGGLKAFELMKGSPGTECWMLCSGDSLKQGE